MKAVVLAGGKGMRLYPLTKTINKHALPCGKAPLLWYPLWTLALAGFTEVLIVTDRKDAGDIVGICGSGKELGMDITYRIQDQAGGVAEALSLAKTYVQDSPFVCLLGDNIFTENDLADMLTMYAQERHGYRCYIASCVVPDPLRYALVSTDTSGKVISITEKPKIVISDLALTGLAIFDKSVFQFIDNLTPSARNELEYTDVLNQYIKEDALLNYIIQEGTWVDAGTFSGMDTASRIVANTNLVPFPVIKREDL